MAAKPIPDGYHTITAQLNIDGAAKAIEFYKKAFGAEELERAIDPSGQKVWHAALKIGSSIFFVNDVFPDMGGEPSKASLWLYVPDADAAHKRAVDAGATGTSPLMDMFWGDRMGQVADPFGIQWTIATHIKDLTKEEMKKAEQDFIARMKQAGKG